MPEEKPNKPSSENQDRPTPPLNYEGNPEPETPNNTLEYNGSPQNELPRVGYVGRAQVALSADEAALFERARKNIGISNICAIISLFIGGVLLSSVALGFAVSGFLKLRGLASARNDQPLVKAALTRSGIIAIIISASALVVNIAALVYLYPIVMGTMQTGDFGSLFVGGQSAASGSSSTWG